MSQATTAEDYTERYYAHYSDTDQPYDWSSPEWRGFFMNLATRLSDNIGPFASTLDIGCAKGLLVQAFAELGIDSHGFDLSETSINAAHPDVRGRLEVRSATDPIPGRYDLITCIEMVEHLSPKDAEDAIDQMCAASNRIVLSSTPGDFDEPTHVNVHPTADWVATFAARGFYRRTDVDVSYLTPWAIYFEKADLNHRDIVHRYETAMSPMRTELIEKRKHLLLAHRDLARLEAEFGVPEIREELLKTRSRVQDLEAQLAVATTAIVDMDQARKVVMNEVNKSWRWRIGGVFTTPYRLVRKVVNALRTA